jgi:formylglycine-generating enzyme required for sulfatase activity
MNMVYIPGGEFPLGISVEAQVQICLDYYVICNPSDYTETVHTVILDPYWIDQTEVTYGQYLACANAGVCEYNDSQITRAIQTGYIDLSLVTEGSTLEDIIDPEYFDHPAILVSWNDANAYCQWVGARLPTAAEWEAAARGSDGRLYPWGNESPSANLLNYNHTGDTTPVGSFPDGASPYGVLDMAGNVAEWVADWYSDDFMVLTDPHNPQGAAEGNRRMIMGSSWFNGDIDVYLARYYMNSPSNFDILYGFRCAQSEP